MSRIPSILFVSQTRPDAESLVTKVTGLECGPSTPTEVGVWPIDCKYYTANVNIILGNFTTVMTTKLRAEALVVIFDAKKEQSVGAFFAYVDQLSSNKPDVCLAICENFDGAVETYDTVEAFCHDKSFELVELSPASEHTSGDSPRYESVEEYGTTRLTNALLSNPWSGMKRKKWTPAPPATEKAGAKNESEGSGDSAPVKPDKPSTEKLEAEALADDVASKMATALKTPVVSASAASSASDESMGDLMNKLKQLKAKAANLSDEDRKKYAEKVALSFAAAAMLDD